MNTILKTTDLGPVWPAESAAYDGHAARVFFAVCAAVLLLPGQALAEDERPVMEEIVVTGTRIFRPNLNQPTPVISISEDDIRLSGNTDLGRLLSELPAVGATGTLQGNANSGSDRTGLNLPDLRRLGRFRTLTLVNGKRHVGGAPGTTAVDLGSIPAPLVERVEVITGGASAIYGSDAVSGVINIIMREDYEGGSFDVLRGTASGGDHAENSKAAFTVGHNFDGGNFTLSLVRDITGEVEANDLDYSKQGGFIINPDDTGENDGIPDRILVPNTLSERIDENGVLFPFGGAPPTSYASSAGIIAFDRDGNPQPQVVRQGTASFATGWFPDGCDTCFRREDYVTVIPDIQRTSFQATVNYQLNDWSSFYADVKYAESDIKEQFQPAFDFGSILIDVASNAFIDEGLRTELLDAGVLFAPMARFHGFDPEGRSREFTRQTNRIVAGFEGTLEMSEGNIAYDFFYNRGETNTDVLGKNNQVPRNLQAAVNSTIVDGEPVCDSPNAADPPVQTEPKAFGDCVPFNPFGQQNSAEALAFSFAEFTDKQTLIQENAGLSLVSDTVGIFELPGGPMGWAAGIEWRHEIAARNGDANLTKAILDPDQEGGFEVFEGFVEVSLPLISNEFLARELTLDGAIRSASYTHSGSADAWKVGFIWRPITQLTFRGTISEAVRAANIDEAFRPISVTFFRVNDPCDADRINEDPDREANCRTLGIPPDFEAKDNVTFRGVSAGNPDLDVETSESFTFGVIFEPLRVEGLAMTLDVYDIEISNAITFVSAQGIANHCVDSPGGPDPVFCSLLTRDPTTLDVTFARSTFVNASKLETRGIDLQVTYNKQLSDWTTGTGVDWLSGALQVTVVANYLAELNEFIFQSQPDKVDINRGELGDPIRQFRARATYNQGNLSIGWTGRFIGEQKTYELESQTCEDLSPCVTGTFMYHDLNATYTLPVGPLKVELYGGINNVTDRVPKEPMIGIGPNLAQFDALGRYYFVGLRGLF